MKSAKEIVSDVSPRGTPKNPLFFVASLWGVAITALTVVVLWMFLPVWAAMLGGLVVATAVNVWRYRTKHARLVSAIGGQVLAEADQPRLYNVVDGLCLNLGINNPELRLLPGDSMNACVAGGIDTSVLWVTKGVLDRLGLMELEGLIAQQLVRIRRGDGETAETIYSFLTTVGLGNLGSRFTADQADISADLDAVSATRYPPGLVAALESVSEAGTATGIDHDGVDLAWMASPRGDASGADGNFASVSTRIAVLREI